MMDKEKYSVNVDDNFEWEMDTQQINDLDIIPINKDSFHIIKDNVSYKATVLKTDFANKSFHISINGTEHEIKVADSYDMLVKKMGLNIAASTKMNELKAPMPGLVLSILVEAGQTFEKGDPLLILEAMKMENIIKATGDGVVKSIEVIKGAAVEKGQILLELE
ncbi:MAG: biotin carboxyl carrier protein [Maribacter sp.]|jgi:biotin carboxyl carrier protein